jgi:hypothetical protein
VKPRNMLTWMLWSAAAALSSPGHGQALDLTVTDPNPSVGQGTAAAIGLTLFLGALALVRAGWESRRGARD